MMFETWGRLWHAPLVLDRLADAVDTGYPLLGCLEIVADQTTNRAAKRGVLAAKRALESGKPVGEALRWIMSVDGQWALLPAQVADVAGVCRDLADVLRCRQTYLLGLWASLRYPLATLGLAVGCAVGFWVWGVPQMMAMQAQLGTSPDPVMQGVLDSRAAVAKWGWLVVWVMVGLGGIVAQIWRRELGQIQGWLLPKASADYFRLWAMMIRMGVPAVTAVQIGGRVRMSGSESLGGEIARAFQLTGSVRAFLNHGELTGTLDRVLTQLAQDWYRARSERWRRIAALSQPVILALTGFILIALFYITYIPIINVIK